MKNIDTIDYRNAVIRQQMMIETALTGYINSNDERLIKEIQANYGLEPSGYVDYDTFLALKDNAEDKRVRELSQKLYGSEDGNLSEGSYGYSAERLNITLAHVIEGLGLRMRRPRGLYYGRTTAEAVKALQKIFKVQPNGIADHRFLCRLKNEELAIERRLKR